MVSSTRRSWTRQSNARHHGASRRDRARHRNARVSARGERALHSNSYPLPIASANSTTSSPMLTQERSPASARPRSLRYLQSLNERGTLLLVVLGIILVLKMIQQVAKTLAHLVSGHLATKRASTAGLIMTPSPEGTRMLSSSSSSVQAISPQSYAVRSKGRSDGRRHRWKSRQCDRGSAKP